MPFPIFFTSILASMKELPEHKMVTGPAQHKKMVHCKGCGRPVDPPETKCQQCKRKDVATTDRQR